MVIPTKNITRVITVHFSFYDLVLFSVKIYLQTSNNEHDWTPLKYLNVLHHNRRQSTCNMQKYYQLSILGILNMSGHFLQKWWYQLELFLKILERNNKLYILGNLGVYIWVKDQVHLWRFPWDITKILQTYCFRYFGHVWQRKPKVTLSPCRKLSCLFAGKKINFTPYFSGDIPKICERLILKTLGMPGCTRLKW